MAETPAGRLGEPACPKPLAQVEGWRVEPDPASAGRAQTSDDFESLLIERRFTNPALLCNAGPLSWQSLKTCSQGRQTCRPISSPNSTPPTRPGWSLDLSGGPRHDCAIWRPLPDKGRRGRTGRRRTGAQTHRHPRIRRQRGGQALVQFAGIPENPAHAARQLDRPRLHRRGRKLAHARSQSRGA